MKTVHHNVLKMPTVSPDTSRETATPLTNGCSNNRWSVPYGSVLQDVIKIKRLSQVRASLEVRLQLCLEWTHEYVPNFISLNFISFKYKNLAIANRSRVSCAHNTLRASVGLNVTMCVFYKPTNATTLCECMHIKFAFCLISSGTLSQRRTCHRSA